MAPCELDGSGQALNGEGALSTAVMDDTPPPVPTTAPAGLSRSTPVTLVDVPVGGTATDTGPADTRPSEDRILAMRHLWLAALHQMALADGDVSPQERRVLEQALAHDLPGESLDGLHLPGDGALLHRLGHGTPEAEDFLRSALVVALADGKLSMSELALLQHWSDLLGVGQDVLADLHGAETPCGDPDTTLQRLRSWLDAQAPRDPAVARLMIRLIPAQCPFERDVVVLGHRLLHIPPMCRINPLYEQLMALRFRCLCLLADEAPPDQSPGSPSEV